MVDLNKGLDLENELTCSICAEVLYQPLTLLDCLHTFCGSCLKEWFSFQLASSRSSPNSNPLPPGATTPYTCPSCRAPVRDTKHNATVNTLLEMFVAANPEKGKTAEEKEEMRKKYTPGENVLPKVEEREKTLRERRVDDADRRLMDEVRDLSLREVGVEGESSAARRERRRREERLRTPGSREDSGDSRGNNDESERRRREAERRRVRDDAALRPAGEGTEERRRRRSNEERRTRQDEAVVRQVDHQPSLRSLISSSEIDSREMEEEILRQIREEGLLDGIDLENLDVNQEDQISERIAEAYRRRQEERSGQNSERRSGTSGQRRRVRSSAPDSREASGDDTSRRRQRNHSRSPSGAAVGESTSTTSRPPQAPSASQATHLDTQPSGERRRRRGSSASRSATTPVPGTANATRPASRSQTDLSNRPQSAFITGRPSVSSETRRTTDPSSQRPSELPASELTLPATHTSPNNSPRLRSTGNFQASELPVREPITTSPRSSPQTSSTARMEPLTAPSERRVRAAAPADISVAQPSSPTAALDRTLVPPPLSPSHHTQLSLSDKANAISSGSRPNSSSSIGSRNRPTLYPEPIVKCARCQKEHIEYELHYNCGKCYSGNFNICLSCYRSGAGCLHWFGFGYAAWNKFENLKATGQLNNYDAPHMMTANRYLPPYRAAGGAEGRKTLTTDDPHNRLQSGAFCANCLAWANECYWRCDSCNEGDWGFCNICVNQGRSCTHDLLPLTYKPSEHYTPSLSASRDQKTPPSASILTGPGVIDVGPFKPLTFSTTCDICHYPIQPSQTRYHCYSCTSKVPNTLPGDYDICTTCYPKLVASRRISVENGPNGWRRCLQGHRMVIVGFEDKRGGQRRLVVQDLVGGRSLIEEPAPSSILDSSGAPDALFIWSWGEEGPQQRKRKLVTKDVMKVAPTAFPPNSPSGFLIELGFPPAGGLGVNALALWSWYPAEGVLDELLFPRGAEVREARDVNGDWWKGVYMGREGLLPAPFVRRVGEAAGNGGGVGGRKAG